MVVTSLQEETLTRTALLERARRLVPILKERAAATEQLGRVPVVTVEALLASGLTRITVPGRFGGLDVGYDRMLEVGMELGRGCGATGWCYSLWGAHAWLVGHWPLAAQEEVFGATPDVLCSASFFPGRATCIATGDGDFRLDGSWEFTSGCDNASWLILGARHGDGGVVWVLVPRSDVEIVQDSWHVSGLQGTGSKEVVIRDAPVPRYRVLDPRLALDGQGEGRLLNAELQYRIPVRALLIWDLVAPMVGIAQGMLDEFSARLHGKSGPGRTGDSGAVLARLATSSAQVDAARALLRQDVREIFDTAQQGSVFLPLDRARYQRDKAYVTSACLEAVNRLFDVAGGHALFTTDPLQRWHRDANAAAHRDLLVIDFGGLPYARLTLGLPVDPSTPF